VSAATAFKTCERIHSNVSQKRLFSSDYCTNGSFCEQEMLKPCSLQATTNRKSPFPLLKAQKLACCDRAELVIKMVTSKKILILRASLSASKTDGNDRIKDFY
jgi:hypothetical protein